MLTIPCLGTPPCYASEEAAGADLVAKLTEPVLLKPLERILVSTQFYLAIPKGYEAQVRPRSGLALNHGITVLNSPGTLDSDYRGEVKVLLVNLSNENWILKTGMKIAQLVVAPVIRVHFEVVTQLPPSIRAHKGFGSSGL